MATALDRPAYNQTSSRKRRNPFDEERKLQLREEQAEPASELDFDPNPEPQFESRSSPAEETPPPAYQWRPSPKYRSPGGASASMVTSPAPTQSGASTAERLMQQQIDAAQPVMDEKVRKSKGQSAADFYRKNPFDSGFFKTAEQRAEVEASRFPVALPRPRPRPAAPPTAPSPAPSAIGQAGKRIGNTIVSPYGTASVTAAKPAIARATGETMGPTNVRAAGEVMGPTNVRATGEQMGPTNIRMTGQAMGPTNVRATGEVMGPTAPAPKVAMRATAPQLRPVPVAPAAAAPAAPKAPDLGLPPRAPWYKRAAQDLGIISPNPPPVPKPLISNDAMNAAVGSAARSTVSAVGGAAKRAADLRLGDLTSPLTAAATVLNLPRPRPRATNQTAVPPRKKNPFNT